MDGGETDKVPFVLEVVIVDSAYHVPKVELFVDSLYCISYEEIALFVPEAAPLHERVALFSLTVAFTEQEVGAMQAVVNSGELNTV